MKTIYSEETEIKVGAGQSSAQIESALQDVIVRDLVHSDGFQRAINQAGLTDERGVVADAGVYTVHIKVTTPSVAKKVETPDHELDATLEEVPYEPGHALPKQNATVSGTSGNKTVESVKKK